MLTVSNYHYIRENFPDKYPSIFGVTPKQFKLQLQLLKNEGDFISVNEIISDVEGIITSRDNYILITFDDGLKEQVNNALPILDELNLSALFFPNSINFQEKKISSVHKIHLLRSIIEPVLFLKKINNGKHTLSKQEKRIARTHYRYDNLENAEIKYFLNFKLTPTDLAITINSLFENYFSEAEELEKLYMDEKDLIYLAKKGYLGSHTHSHLSLGQLDKSKINFELLNSKKYLEDITNCKIETVSYPFGNKEACTNEVRAIAEEVGYKIGFTTKRGVNTKGSDCLMLRRFNCNDLPGGKNYKLKL